MSKDMYFRTTASFQADNRTATIAGNAPEGGRNLLIISAYPTPPA